MQAGCRDRGYFSRLGIDGSRLAVSSLAVVRRVGFAVLACVAVARCSGCSRAGHRVEVLSVASRLKTLVHDFDPWLVLRVGSV